MVLGIADSYQAVIHMQGGDRVFTHVNGATNISWGRKLDDYSEASITVAKSEASSDVCSRLGHVHTWGHELSIYRNDQFVWQGPIVNKEETRSGFTFEARDMLGWFDRRVTLEPYNWTERTRENPGAWGPADSAVIVGDVIAGALGVRGTDINDDRLDPNLLPYLIIPGESGVRTTFQALQIGQKNLGEAVRSIIDAGLAMFTIGRYCCFYPTATTRTWKPLRLTEDDFLADLVVREAGLDAATLGVVVGSQPQNEVQDNGTQPPASQPTPVGVWPYWVPGQGWTPVDPVDPFYGAIFRSSSSQTATTNEAARSLARLMASYGNPPPVDIIVPNNAQLSPDANVTIDELVPGYPVTVALRSYCTPVTQRFVINEVEVTADVSSDRMNESVQVSLANEGSPLSDTE